MSVASKAWSTRVTPWQRTTPSLARMVPGLGRIVGAMKRSGRVAVRAMARQSALRGKAKMLPTSVFVDRLAERSLLEGLLEAARHGKSGALVVYGDAGMGKTALLDCAVSLTDLPVARTSGVEAEEPFSFAALQRLLLPFIHRVNLIPPPQRTALETAFGLRSDSPPDRFMVGLAALSLLSAEASESGLVCVIDDAQWIDVESLEVLGFIARRIWAEGLVLLFGFRTDLELPPPFAAIQAIEVRGLPYEAAFHLLVHAAGRSMPSRVAERVIAETGGCPLALWELGKQLTEAHTLDPGHPVEGLTISRRLEDHYSQQVGRLAPETQMLLLIAAAETSGDLALVRKVARELGVGVDAHLEAEQHRLLLAGPEIRFRHPLIRSAVYGRADPKQRLAAHQALAAAIPKSAQPDRWARHVALGSAGPDEQLASELEATSQIAQARGGYWAQTTLLVRAANLSESPETRSVRLLSAAAAAVNAGEHPYAVELLDQAEPYLSDSASVAEANHLRGRLPMGLSQPSKAPALLLAAARSFLPLNLRRAREILLEAFDAYVISGRFTSEISPDDIASVAEETRVTAESLTLQDHVLDGTAAFFRKSRSLAFEHYRQAGDLVWRGEVTDDQIARWASLGAWAMTEIFDDSTYNLWVARADSYARRNGALYALLFNLFAQMQADLRAGRLRAATGRHAEAVDVAAAIGRLPAEYYLTLDAPVRAWAGDEEGTRAATSASIQVNTSIGADQTGLAAHWALAVLHIGASRFEDALGETDLICDRDVIGFPAETLTLAVEAAVRSDEIEKAQRALAELESRAAASGTPWALGLVAQAKALLTRSVEAEKYFQEAIRLLQQTSVVTEVARTRLLYGEWLRREKRRVDARRQLRLAHDFFADMGAMNFAKRAEGELLATGQRVRPHSSRSGEILTSQEQRVADLAADGQSNIEIASQLFISPRTVEYHLHKVFRKLGVKSRTQLARRLLDVR